MRATATLFRMGCCLSLSRKEKEDHKEVSSNHSGECESHLEVNGAGGTDHANAEDFEDFETELPNPSLCPNSDSVNACSNQAHHSANELTPHRLPNSLHSYMYEKSYLVPGSREDPHLETAFRCSTPGSDSVNK